MFILLFISFYILGAWFLAEFISGVFHWWEDRYGNPDWPIIGETIIKPNIQHHLYPSRFCYDSYWERNKATIITGLILSSIFMYFGFYFLALTFLLITQANEIHSWSHRKTGGIIKLVRKTGLLQNPKQHKIHHIIPYNTYYCVLSNYMNPMLNWLGFWNKLEWVIGKFGIFPLQEREKA